MEQSSLERTIHRIPASRSNVASNKTRLHGRQRVAAYCRVSTDSKDQLNSYHTQIGYYTNTIAQHPGWELVDIYADEGISGTSLEKRDEFKRMLADCRAGKISRILVKSVSRFARNTLELIETTRELKDLGVVVVFEEQGIDTAVVLYSVSSFITDRNLIYLAPRG